MAAEENRLAHFKRLVESRSPMGPKGKMRLQEGYRAVADATGLTYDYVYQVYNGKSGKNRLGEDALKKISRAFGAGKAEDWMDRPLDQTEGPQQEFRERPPTLEEAMETLGEAILDMDDVGREMAGTLLASLVKHPEKAHSVAETLSAFAQLRKRGTSEPDPEPPKPTKIKTTPSKADVKRPSGRSALVLKIGGGEKRQYELQLRRDAFRPASSVTANEAQWYERLRAIPKAANE